MNDIRKSSPRRDLGWSLFDDSFDNLFEGFFRPMRTPSTLPTETSLSPAIDITESDQSFTIKADLPGIKKDDIHVTVNEGVLTISAETKSETEEKEGEKVIRKERRYGRYSRSLSLNQQVDESNVSASFKDGVLELTLPKKTEAKPKKIAVEVS